MGTVFFKTNYEELARAVLAGYPEDEAMKELEMQRKIGGKGEKYFWLALEGTKPVYTTIKVTREVRDELEKRKENEREPFDSVIRKLLNI